MVGPVSLPEENLETETLGVAVWQRRQRQGCCAHKAGTPRTMGHTRNWERKEGPSPGVGGGSTTPLHLDLRQLVSRTGRVNPCGLS